VEQAACRFVPCDDAGRPRETSQFTILAAELRVGSRVDAELLGYSTWEVVELRTSPRPLLAARDRHGNDVPVAGAVVCRGID
jgi:hypothetical protein